MQVSQEQQEHLNNYTSLLTKYHKALDLMSAKGLKDIDARFEEAYIFAETIKALDIDLNGTTTIDIGSGAGLPAIPLAIFLPKQHFTLIERRERRTSFLMIVKSQLKLDNIEVLNEDVQDVQREDLKANTPSPQLPNHELAKVNLVTALWVGDFSLLLDITEHLIEDRCIFISKKASDWNISQESLPDGIEYEVSEKILPVHGKLVILDIKKT